MPRMTEYRYDWKEDALEQLLPALESRLMQEHRIRHVRISNGSGGSRHIFECSRS